MTNKEVKRWTWEEWIESIDFDKDFSVQEMAQLARNGFHRNDKYIEFLEVENDWLKEIEQKYQGLCK